MVDAGAVVIEVVQNRTNRLERKPCLSLARSWGEAVADGLRTSAERAGWTVRGAPSPSSVDEDVALATVAEDGDAAAVRRCFPHALIVGAADRAGVDLVIPEGAHAGLLDSLIRHAEEQWRRAARIMILHRELGARRERTRQLSEIALSLSTRMEFQELLETILREARRLAGCEAGSLYLVDDEGYEPQLVFKLAQNDALDVPFAEIRLPMTPTSLAGYVALSGETLDIPDVYLIPDDAPYSFNRSFDEENGYRTHSMLVLPMRDHRDRIVGVLQFINRLDPTEDQAGAVRRRNRRAAAWWWRARPRFPSRRICSSVTSTACSRASFNLGEDDRTAGPVHQRAFVPGGRDDTGAARSAAGAPASHDSARWC